MNTKKIIDVFSQLQEGYIEEMSMDGDTLNMKIECEHLAGQINEKYKNFYVVLKGVKDIYFSPWDDEEITITSIKDIQLFQPDILNVEYEENDYFKIYSNCENVYSGGCIYISAKDIIIFDEELNPIQLEDLHELSDKYWFSNDKAEG